MKLGKYYPGESEIESAIAYLGKYELNRKKHYINKDYLRGYRCVAHREYDKRCLQYWTDGDNDSESSLYLLAVNSVDDVKKFMDYHDLPLLGCDVPNVDWDCTGARFGDGPIINKLCDGRYTLRYQWFYDV